MRVRVKHRPDLTSPKRKAPGLELHFPARPAVDIRKMVCAVGYRYSRRYKCWYCYQNIDRMNVAIRLQQMGDTIPEDTEPLTPKPPRTGRKPRQPRQRYRVQPLHPADTSPADSPEPYDGPPDAAR